MLRTTSLNSYKFRIFVRRLGC